MTTYEESPQINNKPQKFIASAANELGRAPILDSQYTSSHNYLDSHDSSISMSNSRKYGFEVFQNRTDQIYQSQQISEQIVNDKTLIDDVYEGNIKSGRRNNASLLNPFLPEQQFNNSKRKIINSLIQNQRDIHPLSAYV